MSYPIDNYIESLEKSFFSRSETVKEKSLDFINELPEEMILKIFSYLNAKELTRCFRVCKKWQIIANDEHLWKNLPLPTMTFGKKPWEKYIGDMEEIPPFSKEIYKTLDSPCPFWRGKKVKETHLLVFIPKTVNGKPLNLINVLEFIKSPKEGYAVRCGSTIDFFMDRIIDKYGYQATESHWALMTKDVIEGSRDKSYADQVKLLNDLTSDYEIPSLLDAITCISMHYISSRERLFNDQPCTYTRCQEYIQNSQKFQIMVGNFASFKGPTITTCFNNNTSIGVAALRKFFIKPLNDSQDFKRARLL